MMNATSIKYAFNAGLFALTGTAVILLFAVAAMAAPTRADMNRQIDETNFLVNNNCSATLIDKANGYLLTADHCIADQFKVIEKQDIDKNGVVTTKKVRIAAPGTVSQLVFVGPDEVKKTSYTFTIKAADETLDLAVIKTKAKLPNTAQATLACHDPQRLETTYAVGNPFAVLYSTVTQGIVASVSRNYRMLGIDGHGDHGLIQSTAPIEGGNSGGALYNANFELIGVNVRGSQINETVAIAVPLSDIKAFLAANGMSGLFDRCKGGPA